jgi:tetratricopeptide (TPR) repeat protein
MISTLWLPSILSLSLIANAGTPVAQQRVPAASVADTERDLRHQSEEWQTIAAHLPDPATATPKSLQTAADVLRARRMPEDALDYYQYALARGGDEATLENSIGVTELELRNSDAAIVAFKRAVLLQKKNGKNWNNLGSAEYSTGNLRAALIDYLRAVSLDKKSAVYRSNLASAYFELKDYESARTQFQKAIRLDRNIFREGGFAGSSAKVMSLSDRGKFNFEMAKMSAEVRDDPAVLNWLAKASESGFDILEAMSADKDFNPYRKDPRIGMIVKNAKAMRAGRVTGPSPVTPVPELKDGISLNR